MNRTTATAAAAALLLAAAGHAGTIHVSACGSDANTGLDPSCAAGVNGPKATIAAAIGAAANNDTVLVQPGVYSLSLLMPPKRLDIRSAEGADETTIVGATGTSPTLRFVFPASSGTVIDGFTFTGADLTSGSGAVIRTDYNLTVQNCAFRGNKTLGNGAAIATNDGVLTVLDCVFDGNDAHFGGSISGIGGDIVIRRSVFTNATSAQGGGAVSGGGASFTIEDCAFVGNSGRLGAALRIDNASATIDRCWFVDNTSADNGGAITAAVFTGAAQLNVRNSIFARNHSPGFGGAITVAGSMVARVDHCTFDDNTSNTTFYASTIHTAPTSVLDLNNSAIAGATPSVRALNPNSSVSHCLLPDVWTGPGGTNFVADPMFADPAALNFRLRPGSPGLDNANSVATPPLDFYASPRTVDLPCHLGDGPDIGAIETQTYDWNSNGVEDTCEIAGDGALDCNGNGVLDAAEASGFPTGAIHNTVPGQPSYAGPPNDSYVGISANQVTLDFAGGAVLDLDGPDLNVYEVDFGVVEFNLIDVLVSDDGFNYVSVKASEGPVVRIPGDATHSNNAFARSYDLAGSGLDRARYVRVRGLSAGSGGGGDGFDLDAVGAIHHDIPDCFATCPGDVNGDNDVDFADLNTVLSNYNSSAPNIPGDTDGDNDVDFADLNTVLSAYNAAC